tara:strand:+ start:2408 stop:3199 length:792 start_codon:yes stop_codon:yes gene_type:complete
MTPLEYFNFSSDGEGWDLHLPSEIHGAFGGVTGGALAAASIALSRTAEPTRLATGIDIHFLKGLATTQARATVTTLTSGRSLTIVRVEFSDASGIPTTEAHVALAASEALRIDIEASERKQGLLGPPPKDLSDRAKPWRKPEGVKVPIIDTARPQAARMGSAIATLVTVPWNPSADGSEGACLAADLSVGPPVDAALPKDRWVPHPNPDLSLRFVDRVTANDLIAIGTCREISRGFATVETEVWQDQSLVATGMSTSLLTAKS